MREPRYYDVVAPVYDTIVPRDIKGICDSLEDIINRHTTVKKIVDLGCGTGRFAIELAKRKYNVCGIDLSEEMLKVAREKAKRTGVRIRFVNADMRDFVLPQKVGVIWARGSIGDLTKLSDVRKAFVNIRRNLSRSGLFVLDVRDYDQHFSVHKKATVRDTRIFKQRSRKLTFHFVLKLNKQSRIATINGWVHVKTLQHSFTLKTRHALRYFTRTELAKLLTTEGFKLLEIMPGYRLERNAKPRLVAVAQPRCQACTSAKTRRQH